MYKAVFFDLDNTLVHRNRSISLYSEKFFDRYSAVMDGVSSQEIASIIRLHDNGGYLSTESPYQKIKEAISNELHLNFLFHSDITVKEILDHWINNFPQCSVPMSGANQLLNNLSMQGYHLGVISNGAKKSRIATVKTLDSYPLIEQLVSSEEAGFLKPNSDIFIKSANDAGFAPQQYCYIGDHPINDIEGARQAGMVPIWLQGFHSWPQHLNKPRYCITSLAEVVVVLASY